MKGNATIPVHGDAKGAAPAATSPGRKCLLRILWRFVQLVLLAVTFLTLDWFRSAALVWSATARGGAVECRVFSDPVRHHSYKPNCTFKVDWGKAKDWYDFSTNSLGLRDERIREVPATDIRPRILALGDSMTEGMVAWRDSYVGRIAAHFPQYDVLNGGVISYSPSNYLNVTRMVLNKGIDIDEVIVFIDISDVQDEAAFYRDADASGAVAPPQRRRSILTWDARVLNNIARHFLFTNHLLEYFERFFIASGHYYLPMVDDTNVFDIERDAWTYRKASETEPFKVGYAPLGVEGGIAKEKAKMTLLWQGLEKRNIAISVVVYPHPAQIVHDTVDSRQVRIWRDWCEGKCKRFISLFPAVFAAKVQCPRLQPGCWYPRLFFLRDVHYNATGNALLANVVIESLTKEPPTKRPGTALQPESTQGSDTR